jgi:hypothetical protein
MFAPLFVQYAVSTSFAAWAASTALRANVFADNPHTRINRANLRFAMPKLDWKKFKSVPLASMGRKNGKKK